MDCHTGWYRSQEVPKKDERIAVAAQRQGMPAARSLAHILEEIHYRRHSLEEDVTKQAEHFPEALSGPSCVCDMTYVCVVTTLVHL